MLSGLGLSEILIILLVTLVVIGPEKIPDMARMLGKGVREVRRASNMFRDMFMLEEGSDYHRSESRGQDGPRRQVGQTKERPGAPHKAARKQDRPPVRPVMLAPARRANYIDEIQLPAAGSGPDYTLKEMAAPRPH